MGLSISATPRNHKIQYNTVYREILTEGNIDVFDAFQPDRQNLTRQTFKAIQRLVKDCDHPSKYFPSNI